MRGEGGKADRTFGENSHKGLCIQKGTKKGLDSPGGVLYPWDVIEGFSVSPGTGLVSVLCIGKVKRSSGILLND